MSVCLCLGGGPLEPAGALRRPVTGTMSDARMRETAELVWAF